jgi:hypothetical protein
MAKDDEIQLSAETIQEVAETLDINAHMVNQYNQLERKVSQLKIKFEAHKIARNSKNNAN